MSDRSTQIGSRVNISQQGGILVAVAALAEQEGLLELADEGRSMGLTEAGAKWMEERGMRGRMPDAEASDGMTAFLAFYSREIGMPLVSDETLYRGVEMAEERIAREGS